MQMQRPAAPARSGAVKTRAFLNLQSLFSGAKTQRVNVQEKKEELLARIAPLRRGLAATPEDAAEVEALAAELEAANPTRKPLASPLLSGRWELLYTTSESILGAKKPAFLRPSGPIYQTLDGSTLKGKNQEGAPLFNSVTADLSPLSDSKVKVQFREFKLLGLLPIKAPPSAIGELDITYLDPELRISRGDKGNLFVLRQADPDARLP